MSYYGFTFSDPFCGGVPWLVFEASTLEEAIGMHRQFDATMNPEEPSIVDTEFAELRVCAWAAVPEDIRQDEETQVVVRRGSGRLAWEFADGSLMDVG